MCNVVEVIASTRRSKLSFPYLTSTICRAFVIPECNTNVLHAGGPSDGIIALKVTPFSIKAFIKYFANDIIGVQYEIPKDCMAANLALTEALFFRYLPAYLYTLLILLQL